MALKTTVCLLPPLDCLQPLRRAYSRTFSRTCSSSSGGSGRGGSLTPIGSAGVAGGGSGCLASSACLAGTCTAHGVLPYLQEEDGGTADTEPSQDSAMQQTGFGAMSAVGPSERAAFPEQGGFRLPYDRMKPLAVPTDDAELPAVAVMPLAYESGRVLVGVRGGGTAVTTGSVVSSQWPQMGEAVSVAVVTQRPLSPPPPPPRLTPLHHLHPRNHR